MSVTHSIYSSSQKPELELSDMEKLHKMSQGPDVKWIQESANQSDSSDCNAEYSRSLKTRHAHGAAVVYNEVEANLNQGEEEAIEVPHDQRSPTICLGLPNPWV